MLKYKATIYEESQSDKATADHIGGEEHHGDCKVLCHYCGRTSSNGVRCLGFCVEDNEY